MTKDSENYVSRKTDCYGSTVWTDHTYAAQWLRTSYQKDDPENRFLIDIEGGVDDARLSIGLTLEIAKELYDSLSEFLNFHQIVDDKDKNKNE